MSNASTSSRAVARKFERYAKALAPALEHAENACLAFAWNAGQRVSYWREEPFEVDAVIEGNWGKWAVEIKTGAVSPADLRGLTEFTRRGTCQGVWHH